MQTEGVDWLLYLEAKSLRHNAEANAQVVCALEDYFAGWRAKLLMVSDIMECFILDYLKAGTADRYATPKT